MRLVIDANIIIAAFIQDSTVRRLLLRPGNVFYGPEFIVEEIRENFKEILEKSGLSREDAKTILESILGKVVIVPVQVIEEQLKQAERIMEKIDKDDVPYVALALAIRNDGIWSDDPHFQKLKGKIRVWRTAELIALL